MRIPRKDFESFLNGSFALLPNLPRPSRGRPKILIARVIPRKLPGLGAEIRSTHSKERLLRHLFLKGTLERLNQSEKQILSILALSASEPQFLVIDKLLQLNDHKEQQVRSRFGEKVRELFPTLFPAYPQSLKTFVPELSLFRIYVQPIRVQWPQRKRGHTDKGTLATTPSWKEQVLWEENEKIVSWKRLKNFLRKFSTRTNSVSASPTS